MDFETLVQHRYSVRAYRPDPVEEEKLQAVLNAVRMAPSARNLQPYTLVVVHNRGREADFQRIYDRDWFYRAPVTICICTHPGEAWVQSTGKNYADVDAAIAFDHLTLAAADLGLGTCWIGSFNPEAAREILGLPPEVMPLAFTPLGYPADSPRPKERKPLTTLVRYEHW